MTIPWNALMTSDTLIEINDFFILLYPTQRQTNGVSMFESMWSSVSSSVQVAQECLKSYSTEEERFNHNSPINSLDGLQKFAQTIDSGKSNLHVLHKFQDNL